MPGTFPALEQRRAAAAGHLHSRHVERAVRVAGVHQPERGDRQFHVDVGVEMQGHTSTLRWNSDKMSFQVKFKFPYGPTELNYPLFADAPDGESATSEFDTLILDAMFNYAWHHQNPATATTTRGS